MLLPSAQLIEQNNNIPQRSNFHESIPQRSLEPNSAANRTKQ
jgi:hypothetical protein